MGPIHPASVLVHIGFHKTATTYLQNELFSREGLGFVQYSRQLSGNLVHQQFGRLGPFETVSAEVVHQVRAAALEAANHGLLFVLSHERLSGYPASGGYDSRLMADRVAEVFPEARILIVIREQLSLIRSVYGQVIADGGCASLRSFLYTGRSPLARVPPFRLGFYEFDKIIAYYQQRFGVDNVLAIPYELLRDNHEEFVNRIGAFATGCNWLDRIEKAGRPANNRVNQRRSVFAREMMRLANVFNRSELNTGPIANIPQLRRLIDKASPILSAATPAWIQTASDRRQDDLIRRVVGNYYAASNGRTSRLINVELERYGYDVS